MGRILSSGIFVFLSAFFAIAIGWNGDVWATEGLSRDKGVVEELRLTPVVLDEGEPEPMTTAEMDQVAHWLRSGSVSRASELLEARLDAATPQHCRQRVLTAVARVKNGRNTGVDALLESCKGHEPIQPHLDILAARAACGEGNIPLMYKRLWRVRKALGAEDAEILAHVQALEIRCLIEFRNPGVALKKVESFLSTFPEAPMHTEFELARIELLERLRRYDQAWSLATEFVIRYSKHPLKMPAEELLARLGDKKKKNKRPRRRSWKNRVDTVRHLVRHKQWEDVNVEINTLEAGLYNDEVPVDWVNSVEQIVLIYLRHRSAFERAENLVLRPNAERNTATWERVFSYRTARGDLEGAKRALKKIPMHRNVRQERLFALHLSFGAFREASGLARKILARRRRPGSTFLFKAALTEWLGGDLKLARDLLARCIVKGGDKRARFFHSMVLRDLGLPDEAKAGWEELVRLDPEGYYGIMAGSRLSELSSMPREVGAGALLPLGSNYLNEAFKTVEAMLPGEISVQAPQLTAPATTESLFAAAVEHFSVISPRLPRAYQAHLYGMSDVVQGELRTLAMELFRARRSRGSLRNYKKHTVGSTLDNRRPTRGVWGRTSKLRGPRMSRTQRRLEMKRIQAMFSAWTDPRFEALVRLLDAFDEPMLPRMYSLYKGGGRLGAALEFQKWAYPMPWRHATESAGREAGVPVVLLHAVMNIESAFYSRAVSRAGARGLFQIMPQTAMRLAYDLGEAPPNLDEMLTRDVSLRYGSQYLARLIDEFQGQIPLVLAGYNAGPHHVKNWLKQRGDIPLDVFVELIPFAQARGYVKKGIARLTSTLRVHSGTSGLYIPRIMDPNTAGQLDY